jgi:hypothetical protein
VATKVCRGCGEQDVSMFTADSRAKDGLQSRCRACVHAAHRARIEANWARGMCFCGAEPAPSSSMCALHQEKARGHHRRLMKDPVWLERRRRAKNERNLALKMEVFDAYGGRVCVCCGEAHVEFLTIDHIEPLREKKVGRPLGVLNGQGREPPKKPADRSGNGLYRLLKKTGFPPGFRVLCMNCNFARGVTGQCPHERERVGSAETLPSP